MLVVVARALKQCPEDCNPKHLTGLVHHHHHTHLPEAKGRHLRNQHVGQRASHNSRQKKRPFSMEKAQRVRSLMNLPAQQHAAGCTLTILTIMTQVHSPQISPPLISLTLQIARTSSRHSSLNHRMTQRLSPKPTLAPTGLTGKTLWIVRSPRLKKQALGSPFLDPPTRTLLVVNGSIVLSTKPMVPLKSIRPGL
jgi:hypothetical protein